MLRRWMAAMASSSCSARSRATRVAVAVPADDAPLLAAARADGWLVEAGRASPPAAGAAALLGPTPPPVLAAQPAAAARMVDTHRCTPRGELLHRAAVRHLPRRVPLITAHKVSGRAGHTYWARWTYKKPRHGAKASRWKRSLWAGDNGRAPGVAVETLWRHRGRSGGPKMPKRTMMCILQGIGSEGLLSPRLTGPDAGSGARLGLTLGVEHGSPLAR